MFTVGNELSYDKALRQSRAGFGSVRKVGETMFLGGSYYAGGIVFKTVLEALEYLRLNDRTAWAVYELDGRFFRDSYLFLGDLTHRLKKDVRILIKVGNSMTLAEHRT